MRKQKGARVVQRERRIYHGDYLDVHTFPVFKKAGTRGKRVNPTSEVQKKLNQKYRENRLTYLLNSNFTAADLEIGLGFDDEHLPTDFAGVQKEMRNYIRRIKTARKRAGLSELKYIYVIERGERRGRWHAHMVLSGGIDRDELERIWGKGYAHTYRLRFDGGGLVGLAKYKVKDFAEGGAVPAGKHRAWAASKNLDPPKIPKDRDGFISRTAVREIREGGITEREIERLYKGYAVTEVLPFLNPCNAGEYLTIKLRKIDGRRRE